MNRERKFTQDDPSYLFVTGQDGKNLQQVSPKGYNLHTWEYIAHANKIIVLARKDKDRNGKFDEEDELAAFEADMNKGGAITEIFGQAFKDHLRSLYDRDWKRLTN